MSSKCPTGRCGSNRICPIANARRYMRNTESRRVRAELRRDVLALRLAGAGRGAQQQGKMGEGERRKEPGRGTRKGGGWGAGTRCASKPGRTPEAARGRRLSI